MHVRVDRHRRPPLDFRHATTRVRGYSPLVMRTPRARARGAGGVERHGRRLLRRRLALLAALALACAAQPALAAPLAPRAVRLAAGPAAFPPDVLRAVAAATGCRVRVVPPLPSGALPRAGVDLIEMRGDDAGGLIATRSPRRDQRAQRDRTRRRPGELARCRSRPGRVAPRDPLPVEPAAAARQYQGLRQPAADEPARALLACGRRRAPRCPTRRSSSRWRRATSASAIRSPSRATSSPRPARSSPRPSRLLHLYADAAQLRTLFRRGEIDLAVGNPATLGDQRARVVAVLPSEGTIATERVLGIVSGSPRGACARRIAGALLAPPAQAAALARARIDAGAQRDLRHARRDGLQERGARTLAHAREQRGGRPSRRGGRRHGVARMGRGVGSPAFVAAAAQGERLFARAHLPLPPAVELLGSVGCSPRAATCGPSTGPAGVAVTLVCSRSVRWASALAWLRLPRPIESAIRGPRRTRSGTRSRPTAFASRA